LGGDFFRSAFFEPAFFVKSVLEALAFAETPLAVFIVVVAEGFWIDFFTSAFCVVTFFEVLGLLLTP
jgi:hypothetical protein